MKKVKTVIPNMEALWLALRWSPSGDYEHCGIDITTGFMTVYVFHVLFRESLASVW